MNRGYLLITLLLWQKEIGQIQERELLVTHWVTHIANTEETALKRAFCIAGSFEIQQCQSTNSTWPGMQALKEGYTFTPYHLNFLKRHIYMSWDYVQPLVVYIQCTLNLYRSKCHANDLFLYILSYVEKIKISSTLTVEI